VIQHEYDHNQGIFFIDRINSLRRMMLKNKLNNIMKGDVDVKYKMKFPQLKKVH
jgi:peptide deformylase